MSDSMDLFQQAYQFQQANQFPQAEQLYRQIVEIDPQHADAWCFLGVLCHQSGRPHEAESCYRRALEQVPTFPTALNCLGILLAQQGRTDEAAGILQQHLSQEPTDAEAWNNLGSVQLRQGRVDEAIANYQRALQLQPDFPAARTNLEDASRQKAGWSDEPPSLPSTQSASLHTLLQQGIATAGQGRLDEAATLFRQALQEYPDCGVAHNNLGIVLARQGCLDEAVGCYRRAIELNPGDAGAHSNLGNVLIQQGQFEEALTCYREAVRLNPNFLMGYFNLGLALAGLRRFDEAEASYRQALRMEQGWGAAHLGLADLLLLQGDFAQGWAEHEWRWHEPDSDQRFAAMPCWDGSPLQGRTILLHGERGLGDTIQFLRYAALVKERGGRVLVECQPALLQLAATCPGIDGVLATGAPLPSFDIRAPLMSLPHILGTTLATVPANIPYLTADPGRVKHWRAELAREERFKVGVVWQGSFTFKKDRERSARLADLAPLAEVEGVALFSVQVGVECQQLSAVQFPVTDLGSRFDPAALDDLAAVLVNLNLLVAVDTGPAHLAGALGVPVWVALSKVPNFRWLLDRDDSPWYPTMKLFRQEQAGQWQPVFERMAAALAGRAL